MSRISRYQVFVIAFYSLVALIITRLDLTQLSSVFIGGSTSDAYEMAHHIWWFKRALLSFQSPFFVADLAYPDGISAVTIWASPLQFFPGWLFAFFMPVSSAYNISILLNMVLNGMAMNLLARDHLISQRRTPALIAGLVFMASPVIQGHLFDGHLGLMVLWPAPLYLYALFNLIKQPTRKWRWLAVLFFVLISGGHPLQIFYVTLPLTGLFFMARLWLRDWSGSYQVFVVAIIGVAVQFLFLFPVMAETLNTSAYVDAGGYVRFSTDLLGVVSPSFDHPVWGDLLEYPRQVLGTNLAEGTTYIGLVAGFLIVMGLLTRRDNGWWMLVTLVAWLLAMGPLLKIGDMPYQVRFDGYESYVTLPWALFEDLPAFNLARTPGRFSFTFAVGVAMLAGYGVSTVSDNIRSRFIRRVVVGLIAILILFDLQFFWPMPTMPATVPDEVAAMRERDDVRSVFNIPWDNLLAAKDAMYLHTWHEKPLIAGQISRQTPVNPAKLTLLQDTLDLALLEAANIDIVILHKARAAVTRQLDGLMAHTVSELGAPYYEDDTIAIFEVPFSGVPVQFAALPEDQSISTSDDTYLYKPRPGWVDFSATVTADNRDVVMMLDGQTIHRWSIDGTQSIDLPIPVATDGYHILTLALDPPCPLHIAPILTCATMQVNDMQFTEITEIAIYEPILFEGGVELAATHFTEPTDNQLEIRLWWRFEQPHSATNVRFVHLVDSNQRLVGQSDVPPGAFDSGDEWAESVYIDTSELTSGVYRILTGWYTSPDIVRFDVLTDVTGANDDVVEVGVFRIR